MSAPMGARSDQLVAEVEHIPFAAHLSLEECYALIATQDVGRVVYTDQVLPAITPLNFVLDGETVVFRTSRHSRLARAVRGAIVAFEVDSFTSAARSGWSVVLVGTATEVTDEAERARIATLPLAPWVGGERSLVIRITPGQVTGRRVGVTEP